MSLLVWIVSAFVTGLLLGPILVLTVAPLIGGAAKFIVRAGIRAGGDWILKPVGGTKYQLELVDYDEAEGRAWLAGDEDDDDREYYDDHGGRMRTLFGKSFGIAVEDVSAVVDPVDCKIGEKEAQKATDGGEVVSQDRFTIEELQNRASVGTLEKTLTSGQQKIQRRIEYINPFVTLDDSDDRTIVDVRDAVTLLSKNGSPETPRKTAENAAQAERAFEDWGELKRNASLIAAFLMGAIVAEFIAGGGGGGGGGGVSSPIMVSAGKMLMDTAAMALGVA
jgi:hypothetical protein